MPASQVTVNIRMYRPENLGDCFLLTFKRKKVRKHILIDCGSFGVKKRQLEIVGNIKDYLAGESLSAVVGTHQHLDHLSGFFYAADLFQQIGIEETWLSWLDNQEDDEMAQSIGQDFEQLFLLTTQIQQNLKKRIQLGASAETKRIHDEIGGLLSFFNADAPAQKPAWATDFLKKLGKKPKPNYLSPGKVFDLEGLAGGVRVYVLGPPRDRAKIRDVTPSESETYDPHLRQGIDEARALLSALEGVDGDPAWSREEVHFPFTARYKKALDKKEEYAAPLREVAGRYQGTEYQKIDDDWLQQAERLALNLDSYTNNSSLVLAFELVATHKFLLFVADAQTGNWRSWNDIQWTEAPTPITTAQMMAKTIFYKVGHHGSHNATLPALFEKMVHPDLMAMIPVDKRNNQIVAGNWRMPAAHLFEEIKKRTKHRVVRMDDGIPADCVGKNPAWEKKIVDKTNDLFFEVELKG